MANWLSSHIFPFVKLSGSRREKRKSWGGVGESVECAGKQLNYFSFILNCEKYVRMCSEKVREKELISRDITR